MTALSPQHIPAQMLTELAFGTEPPVDVAYRYGVTPDDYASLKLQEWFDRALSIKKAELQSSGWTTKKKFEMMAIDLMEQAYHYATHSDNPALKLDVAKYAAKLADMEPKQNQPQLQGTGFSININLSGGKSATRSNTDDRTVIEVPASDLPTMPAYLSKLPFESLTEHA